MGDQFCFEIGGGSYFGWKFMGDEEYEGTRTNSPAVPDSVVFHEAAVGLHGVEAGWPTLGRLTAGEVLLERASGGPRGQFLRGGWREDGPLLIGSGGVLRGVRRGNGGLDKLREITRVANHGNVVHVELSLRLVLESFNETLGRHVCGLILNRVEGVWRGQDTVLTCPGRGAEAPLFTFFIWRHTPDPRL